MKRIWVFGLIAILLISLVTGCSTQKAADEPPQNALEAIKAKGKLVVGTSADFPPYEFHKIVQGKDTIVGFDIEIAKAIAKDLAVELEIKDMKFDEVIPALVKGEIDLAIAGIMPTEERKQKVDFSMDYFDGRTTMLVKAESVDKLSQMGNFNGRMVGAQTATVQETLAKEKFPNSKLVSMSRIPDLIEALRLGKIDGLLLDKVVAVNYDVRNSDLAVNDLDLGSQGGAAVALPKDAPELKTKVDSLLKQMMDDGTLAQYVTEANLNVEN